MHMQKSEQRAYQWLCDHGANKITHNPKLSPDFTTDIGDFEVKTTKNGKIAVTKIQQKQILEKKDITYLVYEKGNVSPEVLTIKELQSKFIVECVTMTKGYVTIKLPRELVNEIDKLVGKEGYASRTEVVKDALRKFFKESKGA